MQEKSRMLALVANALRRQDQTQEQLNRVAQEVTKVKNQVSVVAEKQQGHQQTLRILAFNQRKSQREAESIVAILDSVARMQRT